MPRLILTLCMAAAVLAIAAYAQPAHAEPTQAMIDVCFAPEGRCADVAADAIGKAQHEILVNAYNLTTGAGIVEALLAANARGVDVRLIADKTSPCERNAGVEPLFAAGVPIWIDKKVRIAHAKVIIVDGSIVVAGSYNWSTNAAKNSEDLNVVESVEIADAYIQHWRTRQAVSIEYKAREDWCRS